MRWFFIAGICICHTPPIIAATTALCRLFWFHFLPFISYFFIFCFMRFSALCFYLLYEFHTLFALCQRSDCQVKKKWSMKELNMKLQICKAAAWIVWMLPTSWGFYGNRHVWFSFLGFFSVFFSFFVLRSGLVDCLILFFCCATPCGVISMVTLSTSFAHIFIYIFTFIFTVWHPSEDIKMYIHRFIRKILVMKMVLKHWWYPVNGLWMHPLMGRHVSVHIFISVIWKYIFFLNCTSIGQWGRKVSKLQEAENAFSSFIFQSVELFYTYLAKRSECGKLTILVSRSGLCARLKVRHVETTASA